MCLHMYCPGIMGLRDISPKKIQEMCLHIYCPGIMGLRDISPKKTGNVFTHCSGKIYLFFFII